MVNSLRCKGRVRLQYGPSLRVLKLDLTSSDLERLPHGPRK